MCTANLKRSNNICGQNIKLHEQIDSHDHLAVMVSSDGGPCSDGMMVSSSLEIPMVPLSKTFYDDPLTSNMNQIHEKKRVSIDERVQVRITITREEINLQEHDAAWYSREEYEAITQSCCKQIIKLNRGEQLQDKKYCARGLESHTRTRTVAKSMNRSLAYQAVFEEQDRQLREGNKDDEALARVYYAANSSCQLWATVVGLNDRKEAENIYDDDSEKVFGLS